MLTKNWKKSIQFKENNKLQTFNIKINLEKRK